MRQSRGTGRASTAALMLATAVWNVLQNRLLPRPAYVPANLIGTAAAFAAAGRLGLGPGVLGATPRQLRDGLRTGVALAAPAVGAILAAERSPRLRRLFDDRRTAGVTRRGLVFETAVRIPFGTAVFEETLFRGLLLSWFQVRTTTSRAVTWSSVLFGLWHVLPAWQTMAGYAGGILRTRSSRAAGAGLGAAVVLAAGVGAGFSVLRLRTGSLATPIVVHAAVNAAAFGAARRVVNAPR